MKTENYFEAIKIIEQDGIDGINSAVKLIGRQAAIAVLMSKIRRDLGSTDTYPSDPGIDVKVKKILSDSSLLEINSFEGEYRFLSNFYFVDVSLDGIVYPTVEHAFQAAKTLNRSERLRIRKLQEPGEVKNYSKGMTVRSDWTDELSLFIMNQLISQKFSIYQNPELAEKLIWTGDLLLIEGNNWNDTFWGICDGKGENRLGTLLMEIREERQHFIKDLRRNSFSSIELRLCFAERLNIKRRLLRKWIQIFDL